MCVSYYARIQTARYVLLLAERLSIPLQPKIIHSDNLASEMAEIRQVLDFITSHIVPLRHLPNTFIDGCRSS